jgi:hypothetical protein
MNTQILKIEYPTVKRPWKANKQRSWLPVVSSLTHCILVRNLHLVPLKACLLVLALVYVPKLV